MIVTVKYRDPFQKEFKVGPYTYKCDLEVKPGDLVLVETRFGISMAQINKINQKLVNPTELMHLKNVLEKCKTVYPFYEER